jgi:hypothetical protein
VIQGEDCRPRRRSWLGSPQTRSCPELLRVTGPLLSLVLRTENVWQRYNHFHRSVRGSQSGFPLLTPTMQAGQGLDGGGGYKCTLRVGVVLCIVFVSMLPDTVDDLSTITRCLYFRQSQLCLIKRIRNFKRLSYLNLGYSYSSFF